MSRGRPDRPSIYAIEGTAAHDVAAQCLRDDRDANEFLDRYIDVIEDGADGNDIAHKIPVDEEMVEGVQLYLDMCAEDNDYGFSPDNIVFVEQRVSLNDLYPDFPEPLFGTCDYGVYKPAAQRLVVDDFKYGAGVIVDAVGNDQIRYYALGLLLLPVLRDKTIKTIELKICQPRGYHAGEGPISSEVITVEELLEWADKVWMPAARRSLAPDAPLAAGPHCLFCRASGDCEAERANALTHAMVAFDDLNAMPLPGAGPPRVETLTVEELSKILEHSGEIAMWLRSVRERAFALMNVGIEVPGWKVVSKKGRRKWLSDDPKDTAAQMIFTFGVPPEVIWAEPKLKSPRQLEISIKKLGRGSGAKQMLTDIAHAGLWHTPTTGTTLAKVNDPRPAIENADIASFERLDDV